MARNVVPFGKYKGQPVEVLAADRDYCDWLAAQPWFRERFRDVYNVVVQMPGEERDTPEHNALQARFLDDALCVALWRHLDPTSTAVIDDPLAPLLAEARERFAGRVALKRDALETQRKRLDSSRGLKANASPSSAFSPAYYDRFIEEEQKEVAKTEAWLSSAEPFVKQSTVWYGGFKVEPPKVAWRVFEHGGFDVVLDLTFAANVSVGLTEGGPGEVFDLRRDGRVCLECKPAIGDDYPSVLRQILRNRGRDTYGSRRLVAITLAYTGSGATLEQVRAIYAASGVSLVLLEDFA